MLIAPRDEDGLTCSIQHLLREKAHRREMGQGAKCRCRSLFDIEVVAPRYLEIYDEVTRQC